MGEQKPRTQEEAISQVIDKLFEYFLNLSPAESEEWDRFFERTRVDEPAKATFLDLPNLEWQKVRLLLYKSEGGRKKTGRPRQDLRQILEGILWYIGTKGTRWVDLPKVHPPHQTCYRYFRKWKKNGVLWNVIDILDFPVIKGF